MLRKILVPLDGSEQSFHALEFAMDLAEKYSTEIILLNVLKPHYQEPLFPPLSTPAYDEMEDEHKKMLSQAFKKAKKIGPDIKISKKFVAGRPAEKIVEVAKEENIDLIVMGSRGLGGIREFLLGSVSDRVADHAHCPVLIVK